MEFIMNKLILVTFILILSTPSFANSVNDLMLSKSPADQTRLLGANLNASGELCNATYSFFQGEDKDGNAYWNIACSNGSSFAIQIANNETGTTKIIECNIMESMGIKCFQKFK